MSRYRILYFCMLSMAVSYYVMDTRYLSWLLLVMILVARAAGSAAEPAGPFNAAY